MVLQVNVLLFFWFEIFVQNILLSCCFQSASALTWVKEKSEASAQKLKEAAQAYKNLSKRFNELKSTANDKGNENVRLKKKLEELEAAHSAREV